MSNQEVWFVTGANRGIGAEIARAALAAGKSVVAGARSTDSIVAALGTSDSLLAVPLDLTDAEQVRSAIASAISRFGRIDVLVNNASYGQLGVIEETSLNLVRRQFETNTFGTMSVTLAVLPHMRRERSGHIFSVTSIAGAMGAAGMGAYAGSKFAIEGWMESLGHEVAEFGIKTTIVEPGFFRTDFLDASSAVQGDIVIDDYTEISRSIRENSATMNHQQMGDPAKLGAALLTLAESATPPMRFIAGSDAVAMTEAGVLARRHADLEAWRGLSISLAVDA